MTVRKGSLQAGNARPKKTRGFNGGEQRYRHLFENAPIMIYVTDLRGRFINLNQAGARMMGYGSAGEILGLALEDIFFSDPAEFSAYERMMARDGIVRSFQTRMRQRNGRCLWVDLTGTMRTTVTGKLKGYEGFVIDITDRVETEARLQEAQGRYRSILDNSLAAIYMFQEGGHFSFVNKRFIHLLGYEDENEILGRQFWEFVAPEDRKMVRERGLRREREEFSPRQYPYRMLRKDGSVIWVDMRSSHAAYMGIPAAVGNFIDISREKRAQEEIRRLSRSLIKGIEEERRSLASDLHDEFGQALTLLQFDIESLKKTLPEKLDASNAVCDKLMVQIRQLAEKVRNTTSRLRPDLLDHLGLIPTLEWYVQDFHTRINTIRISFRAAGFKRRLPPDVEIVIYRIFQEALNNTVKHARADRVDVRLTASHPRVIFIFQDNGDGFVQDEIGMPAQGASQGIGLLSMKERVASLDGTIKIKSVPNRGTTIGVELPTA